MSSFQASFNFPFMKKVQIPNIRWTWNCPVLPEFSSDTNQKVVLFQNVLFWGLHQPCFYEESPNYYFLLSEPQTTFLFPHFLGPLGLFPSTLRSWESPHFEFQILIPPALRCFMTWMHNTRMDPGPKSVGDPCMKNVRFPKFLYSPREPGFLRPFFPALGKPQISTPNILLDPSSSFQKCMTLPARPKPWKEIDFPKTHLSGSGPRRKGSRVRVNRPKITFLEYRCPWMQICCPVEK